MRVDPLPAFSVAATGGKFDSAVLNERALVLYFYPKDATSGCTTEALEFQSALDDFAAAGVRIVGVSRDSLASHARFRDRQGLAFDLISDSDEALCTLFDVIRTKSMYGREVCGIQRSTFLFDQTGRLRQAWRGIRVPGHVAQVLEAARSL